MIEIVKTIIYCIYFLIVLLVKRSPDDGTITSGIKRFLSVKIIKWIFLVVSVVSLICNAILFPRVIYLAYVIKTQNQKYEHDLSEIKKINDEVNQRAGVNADLLLTCNRILIDCESNNSLILQSFPRRSNK